jgi:hypothetical protein
MSLEPGQFCKVSWRARKSLNRLHLKPAPDLGYKALCACTSSHFTGCLKLVENSHLQEK